MAVTNDDELSFYSQVSFRVHKKVSKCVWGVSVLLHFNVNLSLSEIGRRISVSDLTREHIYKGLISPFLAITRLKNSFFAILNLNSRIVD